MPFQNDLPKTCSEFKKNNGVNAYVGAYSANFLDDSELLDFALAPFSITINHSVPTH